MKLFFSRFITSILIYPKIWIKPLEKVSLLGNRGVFLEHKTVYIEISQFYFNKCKYMELL